MAEAGGAKGGGKGKDSKGGGKGKSKGGKPQKRVAGTSEWAKYASGYPWDLSDEQREIIEQFVERAPKDEVADMKFEHETDHSFAARILRARKYDVEKALEMLHASSQWRREKRPREIAARPMEEILGCPEYELRHFYPNRYLDQFDVEWRPVYFEQTGKIDIQGVLCSTTQEALVDAHLATVEGLNARRMAESTRQREDGHITESTFNVLDMEGVTLGMFSGVTRKYLGDLSGIDQDNYPETLGHMLLINTPTVFSAIWAVLRGFLDERTQRKIEVLGSNYHERLFELMGGPDKVPVEYGGRLEIPGGIFSTPVRKTTVLSGKSFGAELEASAGDRVRCRWIARPADVEFSVIFRPKSGGPERSVYPLTAHPSSATATIEVSETATEEGTYVATWDNSKGWKARVVDYSLVIVTDDVSSSPVKEASPVGEEEAAMGGDEGAAAGGGGAAAADEE